MKVDERINKENQTKTLSLREYSETLREKTKTKQQNTHTHKKGIKIGAYLMLRRAFNIQQRSDPALREGQLGKQTAVVQCAHGSALMVDFQSGAGLVLKGSICQRQDIVSSMKYALGLQVIYAGGPSCRGSHFVSDPVWPENCLLRKGS